MGVGGHFIVLGKDKALLGCGNDLKLSGDRSFEGVFSSFSGEEKRTGERCPESFLAGCDDGFDKDGGGGGDESEVKLDRSIFWESQQLLLQEILQRYFSSASKLRQEIGRLIEMGKEVNSCECPKSNSNSCSSCLRQGLVNLLCTSGFNATLCTSQWNKTRKIPGGRHEFIQVIVSTQGKKKEVPILIELDFLNEFKMAKACDQYQKLINQLPEIFIGRSEHLDALIRVACDAAKRSTTEKKIHMGPWRKRDFMQRKWSGYKQEKAESLCRLMLTSSRQVHVDGYERPGLHISSSIIGQVA